MPNYPTASCTGVPAGTTFTNTVDGDYTVTTAGQVINAWHIRGAVVIKATGVVIENSQIDDAVVNDDTASSSSFTITDTTVGTATCETGGFPSIDGSALNLGSVADGQHLWQVKLTDTMLLGSGFTTALTGDAGAAWTASGNVWVSGSWEFGPIDAEGTCSHQTWTSNATVTATATYQVTGTVSTAGCVDQSRIDASSQAT